MNDFNYMGVIVEIVFIMQSSVFGPNAVLILYLMQELILWYETICCQSVL